MTTINKSIKPVALIMAGYNKPGYLAKKHIQREIKKSNDGDAIYIGENKFLHKIEGKAILQYVLDAVYNAQINGEKIYEAIYIYNDVDSFNEEIDLSQYENVYVQQMTNSLGGHWQDFYHKFVKPGQRMDYYFGDTPRITCDDVVYVVKEYERIFDEEKDHRGVGFKMIYNMALAEDMHDTWCPQRMKLIKHGKNKGKHKYFVNFENFEARIANGGSSYHCDVITNLVDKKAMDFLYNMRKALTPSSLNKILFYLVSNGYLKKIKQIKNRNINYEDFLDVLINISAKINNLDLNDFALYLFPIKQNTASWENDVDGPLDEEFFKEKFAIH